MYKETSRRKFIHHSSVLLGATLLGKSLMGRGFAATNNIELQNGIGAWSYTKNGLPVFQYTGKLPFYAVDKTGKDALQPEDPQFILGNYKCTLFAHASGIIQFLTGERGWARVNAADKINYGINTAQLSVMNNGDDRLYDLVGTKSLGVDPSIAQRFFGTGFARYEYNINNQIECKRILSVKPSLKIHTGNPSVTITVLLKNNTSEKLTLNYQEQFHVNYVLAHFQKKDKSQWKAKYKSSIAVDTNKQTALSVISYNATGFLPDLKLNDSNLYDLQPASLFMQVQETNGNVKINVAKSIGNNLTANVETSLLPNETKSFTIVIGLTYSKDFASINSQIKDLFTDADFKQPLEGLFINQWKQKLPDLSAESNDVFKREMLWNAYTLEAMATYSAYFKETFVPQGLAYTYEDGENTGNRDHSQASLPLCYTNPALAKSALRFVMKHSTYNGEIKRDDRGFGYIVPTVYKESDEQLYLFMAIAEYLRITKDYGFLKETITYYPLEYQKTDTVINLLKKHFVYLRDEVGRGENGLVKILNSDWSDSFFREYSPNVYAGAAESVLNSAMALAVLPNLAAQLKMGTGALQQPFISALEQYNKELSLAFMKDFGNRDFAARCYLNTGHETNSGQPKKFGVTDVNLEPQGYLLQMPEINRERKNTIYRKVKSALYAPEKIGFRIREKPLYGVGEGEDGGVWFSLEGPMVIGVSLFDKKEAWALLERMTFNNFAKQYPDYWVGHWTLPDDINSTLSPREGLYFYWEKDMKNSFHGFCCHPHSWPLYCYFKLKEDASK